MSTAQTSSKDHWSAKAYNTSADFFHKLTTKVIAYLDPKPGERILDIGCGDGPLTKQIADSVGPSGQVLGLDASATMIRDASASFNTEESENLGFVVHDCTRIAAEDVNGIVNGTWDKVFSNAALHWILRKEETRDDVFRDVFASLKPGGQFVFEMGGKGNVAEVHAALVGALVAHGFSTVDANEASPWYFPSETWMRQALERSGFEVEVCEIEYRPTKLTSAVGGGLEGWVRLMGAQFLEKVEESKRDSVVQWVLGVLEGMCRREEDGTWWIGYVRLRAVARKSVGGSSKRQRIE